MNTATKNALIRRVAGLIEERQEEILLANQSDLAQCDPADRAIYDRLLLNGQKIEGMINSLLQVAAMPDPVGKLLYSFSSPQGLSIENRSSPFGTILIIYESRPDVTIEAAVIAFKAGNRILLKGGREARLSNLALIACWQTALREQGLDENFVTYLDFSREQIQTFLRQPDRPIDLIVPRGGEKLIAFVKEHASCPVLVSGRGNNFAYIHP
ncbi:MAG TPA: glutamate-5-semialdehyde dehydrogenase, partial [Phaeodactylibacter sp.]|nr:glutamate-5-semialdehyde dehydrogenase [Phaeodactylibacter sp.]